MKIITVTVLISQLLCLQLNALEEPRERLHSARKAIDSVGKAETKEVSIVQSFKSMFEDAKISGQLKSIYASNSYKNNKNENNYATAIGGIIKYELASLAGFNAAVAIYTSHDTRALTGSDTKQNPELSSSSGSYTQTAEAYLNYKYADFNFRTGRQLLDTPLADSDDIRMIQNSFEAYVASYNFNGFKIMAGNIQSWQGFDAGLETPWQSTGRYGTNFAGIAFSDIYECNIWFYNITEETNALYIDAGIEYPLSKNITLHSMAQYLTENELKSSGIDAKIYGGMLELVLYDLGINLAFNKAFIQANKESFSGTGGGALFTNMDSMILDTIAHNENAEAVTFGLSYEYANMNFLYANGNFKSSSAHIMEQNIGFEYNVNDEFLCALLYVIEEDKKHTLPTDNDWQRAQLLINYNF